MATSGGWDNDDEDDEQGYSAEEMDIDQVAGGSAAASGMPHAPLSPEQYILIQTEYTDSAANAPIACLPPCGCVSATCGD